MLLAYGVSELLTLPDTVKLPVTARLPMELGVLTISNQKLLVPSFALIYRTSFEVLYHSSPFLGLDGAVLLAV